MKRLLPKSEFGRNVLTLMTGTSIAQAIPIAVAPILTRIFSPQDFGVFALYSAIALVSSAIATGRYDLAITLPSEDEDALHLLLLSLLIALSVSILLLVVVVLFNSTIASLLGNHEIKPWLYFVPVSVFLTGVYQSLNYWLNRHKRFKGLAFTRIVQSCLSSAGQAGIGLGIHGSTGLVLGSILGQFASVVSFITVSKNGFSSALKNITMSGVWRQAERYKRFPLLQAPATLIEANSAQLPVMLLGVFFSSTIVGFFSLSQRVIRLPMNIVGSSIGDVFRQRASRDFYIYGDSSVIFIATLKKLLFISTPLFLIFIFLAPDLFALVFGENWRVAGEYAQIMTPLFWLSFVVSPLSVMFIIAEKQNLDLVIQIILVGSSVSALAVGHYIFSSPKYAIAAFTFVYSVKYLIELYLSYKFCKKENFCMESINVEQSN